MAFFDENIPKPATVKTLGVSTEVLFIRKDDLTTIGALTPTGTDNPSEVTITTAHVPAATKGFMSLKMYAETGQLTDEQAGAKGAEQYPVTLVGVAFETDQIKSLRKENPELIILVKDADCADTRYKQIGNECIQALLSATYDSDIVGGSGRKGYNLTITCPVAWEYYDAAVTLLP